MTFASFLESVRSMAVHPSKAPEWTGAEVLGRVWLTAEHEQLLDRAEHERLVDRAAFIEAVQASAKAAESGDLHEHAEAEAILEQFSETDG